MEQRQNPRFLQQISNERQVRVQASLLNRRMAEASVCQTILIQIGGVHFKISSIFCRWFVELNLFLVPSSREWVERCRSTVNRVVLKPQGRVPAFSRPLPLSTLSRCSIVPSHIALFAAMLGIVILQHQTSSPSDIFLIHRINNYFPRSGV